MGWNKVRMKHAFASLSVSLVLGACLSTPSQLAEAEPASCALAGIAPEDLSSWRENQFADHHSDGDARNFASCLGDPDPFLRDKIGYEGLTSALRSGTVSEATHRELIKVLSANLLDQSADGFLAPFSALGLSELVRTDRVEAFLTAEERADISEKTAAYLANVSDYRAFSEQEGWRHGVAHGADIAMQLALNPNVETASLFQLRDAITQQITTRSGHAFTHGEPERLARPIFFMATRGVIEADDWANWFETLGDPAPLPDWGEAYQSEMALARLHNLKAFARVIYVTASLSENEAHQPLADGALSLMRSLP